MPDSSTERAQIHFRVSADLRKKFAIWCINADLTEQDVLEDFVLQLLGEKKRIYRGVTERQKGRGQGGASKPAAQVHIEVKRPEDQK